ncbi:LOW QUALITY PROTEIN: hypothetical protein PHMEG_00034185 [Phytophthora megakarya]|uniref:Chromo domain-containing protein n=1 Tax=Phytophthora megakarya TaxID=4795 RepID=A0A225URW2_9STRA|nr:LOW QUALITY PROTEIN: hypothetical protein PHMEG_00034185 [Phytophthora megakarya]
MDSKNAQSKRTSHVRFEYLVRRCKIGHSVLPGPWLGRQGTISAMPGSKPSTVQERTALEWCRKMQRDYSYALACAEDLQKKAKRARSAAQTRKWRELSNRVKAGFEEGDSVWLYIPKVRTRLSRKLTHLWLGPFLIDEVHDDVRVKLKIPGTGYRVNPWVHISRHKPRACSLSDRPQRYKSQKMMILTQFCYPRIPDTAPDEYEVEESVDLGGRIKRTRTSKRSQEYLIKWTNYPDPEWIPLAQLNCGALLYEFDQGAKARARFQAMQAGDNHPRN